MSRYHLTNQARADLHDIFVYGFEQFGERQADAYAAGFDHVFGLLAENPQMGRKAKAIAPSVRRHEYGSHIILYEEASGGVLILAIIHGRSVRRILF